MMPQFLEADNSILSVIETYRKDFIGLDSQDLTKDERDALLTMHRNLARLKALILDKRSTRSVPITVNDYGHQVGSNTSQEGIAKEDPQDSPKSETIGSIRDAVEHALTLPKLINDKLSKPAALFVSKKSGRIIQLNQGKKRKHDGVLTVEDIQRECIICVETFLFDEVIKLPCCHDYCFGCVKELVGAALIDETLFKPKCCKQDIPLPLIHNILSLQQREAYTLRELEVESKNRTYCINGDCTMFINPQLIVAGVATCAKCKTRTCVHCKNKEHAGDCLKDEAIKVTEELAEKEGWKRCPVCQRLVELESGCNHIRCHCGKHWCFVCLLPWEQCECPSWTRENLQARAEQIIARDTRRPPPAQAYPDAPVYQLRAPAQRQPTQQPAPAFQYAPPTYRLPPQVNQTAPLTYYQQTTNYQIRPQSQAQTKAQRQYQERVEREMAYLEQNHECEHTKWQWKPGRQQCENCHWWAPQYLFQCRQCRLRACNRCRRNRIMV